MAKSQETFNKKEKEKKRLQKQKEKQEKRENRKSEPKKSFDDMIAYVDENGRITSTPPGEKKKEINLEDIQLGARKIEPEEIQRRGTITYFNDQKGYGFIRDEKSQESIFFHINQVSGEIKERDKVTFETERTPRGLSAVRISIVR